MKRIIVKSGNIIFLNDGEKMSIKVASIRPIYDAREYDNGHAVWGTSNHSRIQIMKYRAYVSLAIYAPNVKYFVLIDNTNLKKYKALLRVLASKVSKKIAEEVVKELLSSDCRNETFERTMIEYMEA